MLNIEMIPVLLSGGSGTRLWPKSRAQFPKQFCELFDESLQTLSLKRVSPFGNPWIVTSETLRTLTQKELRDLNLEKTVRVVYEPVAKNTAAAIGLVAQICQLEGKENEIVGIFPSDHLIQDHEAFHEVIKRAQKLAAEDKIVTIGIRPDYAETGFGYIEVTDESSCTVSQFHEKPKKEKAEEFLKSGHYYWNAGIFIFKAKTLLNLLNLHAPQVVGPLAELTKNLENIAEVYKKVESISIDYALMEKLGGTGTLVCLPVSMGWSDVGSWDSVVQHQTKNNTQVINSGGKSNHVVGVKDKTYAFLGLEDLVVVDTQDALLVSKKGESQRVRDVVDQLSKAGHKVVKEHVYEVRPWGKFEILRDEKHFKSKVITIDPAQQISYQSHNHRQEHWIITHGQGEVVLDGRTIPVVAGDHVMIPLKAKHNIKNTGTQPLEFVEVQTGTYFGEDDIIRYTDIYGRK